MFPEGVILGEKGGEEKKKGIFLIRSIILRQHSHLTCIVLFRVLKLWKDDR